MRTGQSLARPSASPVAMDLPGLERFPGTSNGATHLRGDWGAASLNTKATLGLAHARLSPWSYLMADNQYSLCCVTCLKPASSNQRRYWTNG
jgi:hypothetical protein